MTPAQTEVWQYHQEGFTAGRIAETLGKSRRTVRELLERAKKNQQAAENRDPGVQGAMDRFGIVSDDVERVWFKDKGLTVQIGTRKKTDEDFIARVAAAFQDIPTAPEIQGPLHVLPNMMVVYPLFDVHLGMRAHATISGEEIDLKSGALRLKKGMARVMAGAPNAFRAVVINGGDFTHQTDDRNQTRRSGHILDVDGRNVMTVDEAIEVIAACIEMALNKHQEVEYYSVPGNHDQQNWETILFGLRERYRDHPRVKIYVNWADDTCSSEFSVVEHGEVAIFIHHGDKRTPKDLSMFCAAEFPEVWGRTRYRVVITGHLHHIKVDEFPGIIWMQMPAIAPRDHHASGGYKSHSQMMAIGYDLESESTRNMVKL